MDGLASCGQRASSTAVGRASDLLLLWWLLLPLFRLSEEVNWHEIVHGSMMFLCKEDSDTRSQEEANREQQEEASRCPWCLFVWPNRLIRLASLIVIVGSVQEGTSLVDGRQNRIIRTHLKNACSLINAVGWTWISWLQYVCYELRDQKPTQQLRVKDSNRILETGSTEHHKHACFPTGACYQASTVLLSIPNRVSPLVATCRRLQVATPAIITRIRYYSSGPRVALNSLDCA